MSTSKWTLSAQAYTLPLLHAARHPSASVNGLFIGSSSSKTIDQAIPLHHLPQSLQYTFAQELSFELVAKYVESLGAGKEIVGYYQANERLGNDALGQQGAKVLEALKVGATGEASKTMFALVVVNSKLATSEPAYSPYTFSGSSNAATEGSFSDIMSLSSPEVPAQALQLIRSVGAHSDLRDCDDHLEDASVDFLRNEKVAKAMQAKFH